MKQLNFKLPEFLRIAWKNHAAQETWETRLSQVVCACKEIEHYIVTNRINPLLTPNCHDCRQKDNLDFYTCSTIWQMAVNSRNCKKYRERVECRGPIETNIFLHRLGLKLILFCPCSLHCQGSIDTAYQYLEIGKLNGYRQEMEWLVNLLALPVKWSVLHGIAEVDTPLFTFCYNTGATAIKYTVLWQFNNS